MTQVTTNVLARLTLNFDNLFGTDAKQPVQTTKPAIDNCPSDILRHVHSPATKSLYGHNTFALTYGFWRTLLSAIRDQKLTLELLTDKPSELPINRIWLNHERVTALLAEQALSYCDIPPILFHIIMANTNKLYPGALISEGSIESERLLSVAHNGEWHGEHRYCFCICPDKLPISFSAIK